MRVSLDTSVIVAALIESHPHHDRANWWLRNHSRVQCHASWHAYAETWAVLTAIPMQPRISGEVAAAVLDRACRLIHFNAPSYNSYPTAAHRCSARGLSSGAIYDALHLAIATEAKADLFLTFNVKDFIRLTEPEDPRILAPPEPPGFPPRDSFTEY